MIGHRLPLLAVVACLYAAPVAAQQPATSAPSPAAARSAAGPRIEADYRSYQPALTHNDAAPAMAAAADRTVITISTLGLVLLAVLLIILLT